jgi:hypothetical protein
MRTFGSFPLVDQAWDIPVGTTPFLLLINEQSWQRQPTSVQRAMLRHGGLGIARSSGQAYAAINQQIRVALAETGQPALMAPDTSTQQALVDRSQALHDAWMTASIDRETTYLAAQTFLERLRAQTSTAPAGSAP